MPRVPPPVLLRLLPALLVCATRIVLATPPAAPSNLEVFVTKFSHDAQYPHTYAFLWNDNSTDEDGFQVRARYLGDTGAFVAIASVASAPENDPTGPTGFVNLFSNFGAGRAVEFQVFSFKGTPNPSEFSTAPSNTFTLTIPAATTFTPPKDVTGILVSESVIKVGWTDTSTTEHGVELWMIQLPGGTYAKLGDIAFYQSQEINVTGLDPGIGYRFKLRAYRLGATQTSPRAYTGFSAESATVIPTPTPPTNLAVSSADATEATLTWTDNSQGETGYEILMRPTGSGEFTLHQFAAANATTASLVNLTPGVSLDFAVRARAFYIDAPSLSANSNVATQLMKDVVNSPHSMQVYVGQPFNYEMTTTTGSPRVSRTISGLPTGLTFNDNTGMVTGIPDTPGVTLATMSATFADGSSHSPGLSIRVLNPPVPGTAIPAKTVVTGTPLTVPLGSAFSDPEAPSAVKVTTTSGTMHFILFNSVAPLTVANFMNYVNDGRFADTVFDRSVPGFVVQGGSLRSSSWPNNFVSVPKFGAVTNEFGLSNVRGTISLAKKENQPNSGTNEFFISLENNGAILDPQNGGFTVFGRVAGDGMSVAEAIARKPVGTPFSVVVDGTTQAVAEWPMDVQEPLAAMDNTKVVRIINITQASVFNYAITSNTNAGAVSASVSGTNLILTPVASGSASITVRATNLDGYILSQTFDVTTKSNVATLSSLVPGAGALSPVFSSAKTSYALTVPNATASFTLTPTSAHAQATVQVNGVPVASGVSSGPIPLQPGANVVTVLVTAEDGVTTKNYVVNVTRAPVLPVATTQAATGTSATQVTLNGAVNARGASTTVSFDYGKTTAYGSSIAATPSPVSTGNATPVSATLIGLIPGTIYHYRVKGSNAAGAAQGADMTFSTKSTVATLSKLVLSSGTLSPAFSSATTAYTATVPGATTALTVTPTVAQSQATVQVNGVPVPSGKPSGAIILAQGTNTISILVTAQDGQTTKNYTLAVTRAAAPVAVTQPATSIGATSAKLNGTINGGGAGTAATFEYGLTTAYGSSMTAAPSPVTGGTDTAVSATAVGLMPGKTYHFRVKGVSAGGTSLGVDATFTTPNNVAALSGLVLSSGALSPAFSGATTNYTQTVPNATSSLTVTPTASNANAIVTVNGAAINSGATSAAINLSPGLNTITVLVTAQDGIATKTYTVNVTRLALPAVATLEQTNLTAVAVKLNGAINAHNRSTAASFEYGTTTGYGKSVVAVPATVTGSVVTAVSAVLAGLVPGTTYHYRAKGVSSEGLSFGDDATFTTPSNVATLSGLALSAGALSPAFSSATAAYSATVSNATNSLMVTPTTSHADATVTANGVAVVSGSESGPINLNVGANTISIVGTAQDGTTKKTYTITVTRPAEKATVATLPASGVGTTGATLNGVVNTANNTNTTVSFDYGLTTAYGSSASGTPGTVGGTASAGVSAVLGGLMPGKLYHYRIKGVNAAGTSLGADATFTTTSNVATLSGLVLSSGALSPAFSSATISYTQTVPNATDSLTVTPTVSNANATVTVNGVIVNSGSASAAIALSAGLNTIAVQVTAQDGVTVKTYTIGVTRKAKPIVATLGATNVTAVGARLNGTINALNLSTAASFEYGTTTNYGSSKASTPSAVTGNAMTAVSATLSGLMPGKTYHYRAKGTSTGGTEPGADMIFTTPNNVATLAGIGLSHGILSPVFKSATTAYNVTVSNATAAMTVTPVLSSPADATVTVNGAAVVSGSASGPINLNVGANTISIVGTAQDGTTKKTYTLTVTRSAEKAVVSTQAASGVGTAGVTLNGTVETANNTNTAVSFDYGLTTAYGSSASGTPGTVGGAASTNVSAVLGGLMPGKLYHYRFKGVNAAGTSLGADATFTTTSNVATLSGLVLSSGALSPAFSSATMSYTQTVPNATGSLTVKPTATSALATLTLNGAAINSGATSAAINLSAGLNTITVQVTAQDGVTTKTYTVNVTRLAAPAVLTLDATNVTATGAKMNGAMNAGNTSTTVTFEYGTTLSYGKSATATPSPVTGTASTSVSATLSGLVPGTTYHYRIKGVSAGGTSRGEDETFATPSNVATLANLGLSSGALSPVFASATTTYAVTVTNSTTSITVTPVVSNANAIVTVNDVIVTSGSASAAIPLSPGLNLIMVRVTAQDGVATKSYALNVTRRAPPEVVTLGATNVTATGAKLNGLINALNLGTAVSFDYGTTMDYGSSKVATPTPVTGSAAAAVSATLTGLTPGTMYHYRVKGESVGGPSLGADETFTTPSNVATLSGLALSAGALSPVFASATTAYTATVDNATASIVVTPALSDGGATVKVNGLPVTSGNPSEPIDLNVGANTIIIVGMAEDGVATKTYTVKVTRSALAPTMTTLAATGVSATGATLNGTANANDSSTAVSFDYGLTTSYGKNAVATPSPLTDGTTTPVGAVINGLVPGATYHYRVKGVNIAGTGTGTDATFTTPSNVATLSGLVLSTGPLSPVFASAKISYTQSVPDTTDLLTVTPTATHSNATVTVNGTTVVSGSASQPIAVSPGVNTITVQVTAQDGVTTAVYTVNVTRPTPPPSVVTLQADGITATAATVHGEVDAQDTSASVTFDYGLTTAYGSSAVAAESPANGAGATAMSAVLTGLVSGATYHYRVSALNAGGLTSGLDATFRTPSNVTTLSGLVLSTGAVSPAFSSATTSYTQTVPTATTSLTVKPTATHPAATLLLNGAPIASGGTSGPIPLERGPNVITVQVTAEDGVAMETYTINVTRTTPAPTVVTQQVDNISKTGATVHGTVNAEHTPTAVTFEYGLTTAYGGSATAAESPVSGNTTTPITAELTGLLQGRTYHYRVSAQNAGGISKGADATFTCVHDDIQADLSSASTGSASTTPVVLHVTGLVPGESITVERFVDADDDGAVDPGELLAEAFAVTDGQVTSIAGVRNTNVPGDEDGAADGQVSIHLAPALGSELGRLAGAQIIRVSSPAALFSPVTRPLAITNPAQAQSITGLVTDGTNPVPYAGVVLLDTAENDRFALGVVADVSGQFAVSAPAGSYKVFAFKGGFVADPDPVTLGSGDMLTHNIQIAAATTSISGAVADAGTGAGLGGVQLFVESQSGLVAMTSSNTDGTFSLPVSPGEWQVGASAVSLGHLGYLSLDDQNGGVMADTTTSAATGVNIDVPKVTALIHGAVADSVAISHSGISLRAGDIPRVHKSVAVTDGDGHYVLGVIAGSWDAGISPESPGLAGYIIPNDRSVTISAGQAVQTDLTMIAVTQQITGSVKDSQDNPVAGVRVSGSATVAGTGYSTSDITDAGGNYALPVFAGDWTVGVSRVDLEAQGHLTPADQNALVSTSAVTVNFIAPAATTMIAGSVKDSQNNPISGVQVSGSATLGGVIYSISEITDGSGSYSLPVFPGTWSVGVAGGTLQTQGYLTPPDQNAVVGAGAVALHFVAPLATAAVAGSVKDTQNNPVAGVMVTGSAVLGGAAYATSAVTDAAGNYSLPVFSGSWSVGVSNEGLQAQGYLTPPGQSAVVGMATVTVNFTATQATATIHGTVRTSSNTPVPFVRVTARQIGGSDLLAGVMADANGEYTLGVIVGSWDVGAETTSHVGERQNVVVNTNGSSLERDLVVRSVTAHLRGQVRDNHNNPVGNLTIVVRDSNLVSTNVVGTTDAGGNFDLGVYGGEGAGATKQWTLQALQPAGPVAYVSSNASFDVQDGVDINGITYLVYVVTAHVSGLVLDESNVPIGNIAVTASSLDVAATTGGDVTAGGLFNFPVFAGNWKLGLGKIQGLGLIPQDLQILVEENLDKNGVTFRARHATATIGGKVVDAQNFSMSGVRVFGTAMVAGDSYTATATTDGLGNYTMPVFAGTWEVSVSEVDLLALGYQAPASQSVPVGATSTVTVNFNTGLSPDASLASLALSTGTLTPAFDSATTDYSATVSDTTASITVTPTMRHGAATVRVNEVAVLSGAESGAIDLVVGGNIITIEGTAQDGLTAKTYTVAVTRLAPAFAMTPPSAGSSPAGGEAAARTIAGLIAPAAGSTLTSNSATFQWDAGSGVAEYRLSVGSSVGGSDIYGASQGTALARTLSNLPTDGREFYVTLESNIGGAWQSNTYGFIAWTQPAPLKARLTGPVPNGGVLPGASVAFTWDPGQGVNEYWLSIGTSVGGADLYDASQGAALARTVALPTDVGELYVTLKSKINGVWLANNYVFTAADTSIKAVLSEPADQTKLDGADATFTWNEVGGANEYWLSIGSTEGGADIYDASQGVALSNALSLPTDGREMFVTLKTRINGAWASISSTLFASGSGAPAAARIISPANHSALEGASVTFTWDPGSGVSEYWLTVGTSVIARDVYDASQGGNQSATVTVPTDGSPLYISVHSLIYGKWQSNQYFYEAGVIE